MAGIASATFESSEETLEFERTRMERVSVGGLRIWRHTFEPGWRYTEHVDSELCPAPHAAYVASGRLGVKMSDGTTDEVADGEVVVLEPGHDAWTIGDEPCVLIDFAESVLADGG